MKSTVRCASVAAMLVWAALPAQAGWVVTWSAAAAPQYPDPAQLASARLVFSNQTLREWVHVSIGGDTVRVRLSNAYGNSAVEIGAAHIAIRTSASNIDPNSDRKLTFSGRADVVIPPNAVLLSDPVQLAVPGGGDLMISLFLPNSANGGGIHYGATGTNYLGVGDQTSAAAITRSTSVGYWAFLAGVDVSSDDPGAGAIVTFGDSITDGNRSTSNANHRWTDFLAARLRASDLPPTGIANAGISGNRLLHEPVNITFGSNGLARFGRDAFEQPGVKYVIILLGINDLGQPGTASGLDSEYVTADDVIAGLQQLADRAHLMGLKVYGATLTPFAVYTSAGYYTDDKEKYREAINEWIRGGAAFDAVIDFDMVVRDPDNPTQMLAAYDSGDHLHPGDAGYQAMADSIDLSLFQPPVQVVTPDHRSRRKMKQ
jgi:lysophospholipase L1-like esterase